MGIVWVVPIVGVLAILFAIWLAKDVLSRDSGTPAMQQVAGMIFEGAMAFLNRQYRTIAALALVTAVVIGILVGIFDSNGTEGVLTSIAFILGAFCSSVSGYIGMYVSVRSNLRTASAAQRSLPEAINVAMRGGAVSGFLVTALSLLGVAGIFGLYSSVLGNPVEGTPF
ncbi:MAG: sodium/proton-translocating pyrophosphatase, partial [Chloroflexota bacterium]